MASICNEINVIAYIQNVTTLKEETFAEETFAISRFLSKFAKVCSRENLLSVNRESLFSRKKQFQTRESQET